MRTEREYAVRFRFALDHQYAFGLVGTLAAKVFYARRILFSKIVKSKAVAVCIHNGAELRPAASSVFTS